MCVTDKHYYNKSRVYLFRQAFLDFAHLAVKRECKLLCAVGTKYLIVFFFYIIVIHLRRQLNCGTDVLKDGPSVLPPLFLSLSPLCCYFRGAMFPYWCHLSPWFVCHECDVWDYSAMAAARGTPPSKDKIIIIIKKKKEYNASLSKHIGAACNYHVSCDCISVEINCHFNLVFPLTNPDELKRRRCRWETRIRGPQIRRVMFNRTSGRLVFFFFSLSLFFPLKRKQKTKSQLSNLLKIHSLRSQRWCVSSSHSNSCNLLTKTSTGVWWCHLTPLPLPLLVTSRVRCFRPQCRAGKTSRSSPRGGGLPRLHQWAITSVMAHLYERGLCVRGAYVFARWLRVAVVPGASWACIRCPLQQVHGGK